MLSVDVTTVSHLTVARTAACLAYIEQHSGTSRLDNRNNTSVCINTIYLFNCIKIQLQLYIEGIQIIVIITYDIQGDQLTKVILTSCGPKSAWM